MCDFSQNKIGILDGIPHMVSLILIKENQASKNTSSGNDEIVLNEHS